MMIIIIVPCPICINVINFCLDGSITLKVLSTYICIVSVKEKLNETFPIYFSAT